MARIETQAAVRPVFRVRPHLVAAGSLALIALIATATLTAIALTRIATNAYGATGDFLSFYTAGVLVGTGHGDALYSAAAQEWTQRAYYPGGFDHAIGYPLPAFAAWLFAPFTKLDFTPAFFAWIGMNTALLFALSGALARHLENVPDVPRRVFLAVFALSMPAVATLLFGQVDLIVFAAIFVAYVWLRTDHPLLAGFALALGLFKPHFIGGVVLLLLVWRQWSTLLALSAAGVPLLTVPALLTSPGTFTDNLSFIGKYPASDDQLAVNATLMSNWRGFVTSATNSNEIALWLPGLAIIALVALAIALPRWRASAAGRAPADQAYALAVMLPLLASPHLHTQSLVLMFVPLAIAVRCYFRPEGAARHDDDAQANAVTVMLALYAALFFLWFVGTQGLAPMAFLVLFVFACCAFRWPGLDDAKRPDARSASPFLTAFRRRRYDLGGRRS